MVKTKKKNKLVNRILGIILLLVPGINLINAAVKGFKIKKQIMDDPIIKETIVPMSENEKKIFAEIDGKLEKIKFTILSSEIVNDFESPYITFTVHQINDELDETVKEMEKVKSFDSEIKPEVKFEIEPEIILLDQEEVLTDEQGPRLTKSMRP